MAILECKNNVFWPKFQKSKQFSKFKKEQINNQSNAQVQEANQISLYSRAQFRTLDSLLLAVTGRSYTRSWRFPRPQFRLF